ncbi:MAG: hypothetical protein U1E27_14045, partial [Kiritimatiellia bacterium]|nr:hypothetical protein [Kiritimatiellia bacterium]
ILNFEMAQHRFRGGFTLLVWAALYMGSVAFRHESPADIVRSLGICGFLALLSLVLFLKRPDSARPIPDSPGVRT